MKENKELIEKMREAVKSCFMLASHVMIEKITNEACQVATSHFADKWVRVDDRLPEVNGVYFLYRKERKEIIEGIYEDGEFYFSGIHARKVTHWMPLPEPPQE